MVDAQNFTTQRVEHKVVNADSAYYDAESAFDNVLTNVLGIETTVNLGKRIGSFTVKLANYKNASAEFDYKDFFNYNDIMSIKLGANGTNNLVMKGFLENWEYQITPKVSLLTLSGVDISRKLLDSVYVGTANSNDDTPVSSVITNIINDRNDYLRENVTTNNVATTSYTGYGTLRFNYKQVWEIISKLSTNEYTQMGNFHFWVDEDYDLHWEPISFDTYDTQLTEGVNILNYKVTKSKLGVKNFIVVDAGLDLNGHAIYTYAIDYTAVAENNGEFISDFVKKPDLANDMRKAGGVFLSTDYPFGNPSDYSGGNAQFRNDVRDYAKIWAKEYFFAELNTPLWKATVTIPGTVGYNLNNLLYLHIPKMGTNWNVVETGGDGIRYEGKKFRLYGITQSFNQSGWATKLDLRSDIEVLEAWYGASS